MGSASRMLKMFEPMTLPTHRSGSLRIAAMIDVTNSGRLVPNATTVRPTTSGYIPCASAIPEATRTRDAPPRNSVVRLANKDKTVVMKPSYLG